jgi:hypothetical protein
MKRVPDPREPPIVIPIVVVAVAVHIALVVVPAVEREVAVDRYEAPSWPLPIEYSPGCIACGIGMPGRLIPSIFFF